MIKVEAGSIPIPIGEEKLTEKGFPIEDNFLFSLAEYFQNRNPCCTLTVSIALFVSLCYIVQYCTSKLRTPHITSYIVTKIDL